MPMLYVLTVGYTNAVVNIATGVNNRIAETGLDSRVDTKAQVRTTCCWNLQSNEFDNKTTQYDRSISSLGTTLILRML